MTTLSFGVRMVSDDIFSLRGRVAFVTGASSGMGRHFAKLLARQGASVALAARRIDKLKQVADAIRKDGGTAHPVACDITDQASVRTALLEAEKALGGVATVIVNSGGTIERMPAIEMTKDAWDRVIDTNLTGSFNVAQAAAI